MGMRRRDSDDDAELRRLLAGMSSPTPVPEDLAARISRSIAEEDVVSRGGPHRFDPATARPRRRLAAAGAVAAGLVAVAGVLGAVALHVDDDVVLHQAHAAWDALDGRAGTSDATEASAAPRAAPPLAFAGSGDPAAPDADEAVTGLTVVVSGTDYRSGSIAPQIDAVADGRTPADADDTRPVPSRDEIARCLATARLSPRQAFVDVATFEGRPALVLLGDPRDPLGDALDAGSEEPGGSSEAGEKSARQASRAVVVLPVSCGDSETHPLAGPIGVP